MSGYLERVAELILNKFNVVAELKSSRWQYIVTSEKHKENKNSNTTGVLGRPQLLCFQRPFM